jgi:RND superfamily putative drug exporter
MRHSGSEKNPPTARIARWSIEHRRLVVVVSLLLTAFGAFAASRSSSRLSFRFDLPGQPAFETNASIVRLFGDGGENPPLVAVVTAAGNSTFQSRAARREADTVFARAAAAIPGARIADWATTGARDFVSQNGRTTFALIYPPPDLASNDPYTRALPVLERAIAHDAVAGSKVHVTGASILEGGGQGGGSSVLLETLLAAVGALAVLAFVFGSLLALLPLVIAAVAVPAAFIAVYALTYATTMSTLVQNIIALIGLGVAIDYALLICTRWREESARTEDNREAVIRSAATAGGSVVLSGLTVTVSLAALALTSVPFLRSIGLAGMLVALASVAVSATLLPVILDGLGPRLEWPRRRAPTTVSRLWTRIAELVVGHKLAAAVGSLVLVCVLVAPVFSLELGAPQARATALTAPADARAGYEQLVSSGVGPGVLRPAEILLPAGGAPLPESSGIRVAAPAAWMRDGRRVLDAWGTADPSSVTGKAQLREIRALAARVTGARVGGTAAQEGDFIHALYGKNLLLILSVIVLVTFVILARALGSFWLPIKALLLNALSLAAAFGVVTYIWQEGHLTHALFSSTRTGAITLWVPLAVFSLLFGLSMDYEVFILTRIREEYDSLQDTDRAIVRAIGYTGRLVSSGALILCLAFIALGGVPVTDVKILSTGLAAGIIIDATVIRGVLAPALVGLLGDYNWWLPWRTRRARQRDRSARE